MAGLSDAMRAGSTFERRELAPGVRLHVARSTKWKTNLVVARVAAALGPATTASALVPFVLAQGSEGARTSRDLARRLEELYDAELEPDVLRMGDVQLLELRLDVASARFVGRDTLGDGLSLLVEVLARPALGRGGLFRGEVVKGEKKNLRSEILGLQDERPDHALEQVTRLLGRGTPSERYQLGAVEEIGAIGAASLTARWRELLERHPIDFLVVGDEPALRVEAALRSALPLDLRASAPEIARVDTLPLPPRAGPPERRVETAPVAQAQICVGFRGGASYLGPGYAATLVLHCVLGADAQSRLFLGVRERDGLAYEARTIFDRLKGTIAAQCGVDPKNVERVEATVLSEVERLRAEPVPEEELALAKRFAIERVHATLDDPGALIDFEHARTLADKLDVGLDELAASIEAVGPKDVQEAAGRLALDCVYVLTAR